MSDRKKVSLTLERKKEIVDIGGKDYTVIELTGKEIGRWRSQMSSRTKISPTGAISGLANFEGLEASLICLCLKDPEGNNVEAAIIEMWPASAQSALFEVCARVNALTKEEEDAEKKT